MVEADLRGDNSEVSHTGRKLRSSSADQPTNSSKNRTNLSTAAWEPEPWAKNGATMEA
ncbi:hypothetical protein HOY80DRAFT_1034621 [Tuber brumale]|nr:hypothetical protein HOY80DRAFT_1034621 [Tuber brumale]